MCAFVCYTLMLRTISWVIQFQAFCYFLQVFGLIFFLSLSRFVTSHSDLLLLFEKKGNTQTANTKYKQRAQGELFVKFSKKKKKNASIMFCACVHIYMNVYVWRKKNSLWFEKLIQRHIHKRQNELNGRGYFRKEKCGQLTVVLMIRLNVICLVILNVTMKNGNQQFWIRDEKRQSNILLLHQNCKM